MHKKQSFIRKNLFVCVIALLALVFFLLNLGGHGFSLDEPSTVAVGRTILKYGYPSAWDGTIFISTANGADFTPIQGMYIWSWHPWLQFYLLAPFYYIFGNSVAMLRVPFALLGVATVVMVYFVMQELFKNKWLSALLSLQLIFLLPFFLYVRQIHYYSPSAFLSILLFWLLLRSVKNKITTKSLLLIFFTLFLLFMTNYLTWLSCLPFIFVFSLWRRQKELIIILTLNLIYAILWFHFFNPFHGNPTTAYPGHTYLFSSIVHYASYLNNFIIPLIILPFVVFAAGKLKMLTLLTILSSWIISKILIYALLVDVHGRFLIDVMPFCLLLFGFLYKYLWEKRQIVMVLLIAGIVISTNILSLTPTFFYLSNQNHLRLYPKAFASELSGTYPTAYRQVSYFILATAKPGDLFYSNEFNWEMYIDSNIPELSSLCDINRKVFIGPKSITQPKKVRWYIFFQNDTRLPQSLSSLPCLGVTWQKFMEQHYTRKIFYLKGNIYNINDPDIVNREFPPISIQHPYVIIYERK